jgi:transcription termination factor Rho
MSAHLSELHAQASELGIRGYRKLRREQLVEEIEKARAPKPGLIARLFGGARPKASEPAEALIKGSLQVMPRRFGFLRVEGREDVYVSASQIRRCKLRAGDVVEGPIREPRPGEKHHALARVVRVNGKEV